MLTGLPLRTLPRRIRMASLTAALLLPASVGSAQDLCSGLVTDKRHIR